MSLPQPVQCCVRIDRIAAATPQQREQFFNERCGFDDPFRCKLHAAKALGRSAPGGPMTWQPSRERVDDIVRRAEGGAS